MGVVDIVRLTSTTHAYSGGGTGANGHDVDWDTSQNASCSGTSGSCGISLTSEHTFSRSFDVDRIDFKLYGYGQASGNYVRDHSASYSIEYTTNGSGWMTVAGSAASCSGGDGSCSVESGEESLTDLGLTDVTKVRALASGHGNASGGEGHYSAEARIYEIRVYGTTKKGYGGVI